MNNIKEIGATRFFFFPYIQSNKWANVRQISGYLILIKKNNLKPLIVNDLLFLTERYSNF